MNRHLRKQITLDIWLHIANAIIAIGTSAWQTRKILKEIRKRGY